MSDAAIDPNLYDRDFNLWIADTIANLNARNFGQLDLKNLSVAMFCPKMIAVEN